MTNNSDEFIEMNKKRYNELGKNEMNKIK